VKDKNLQKDSLKRDLIWNTAGSLVYAACIAVLAFLVMRIAGEEDGGIFGFGFSTFGQQMFIVAYFGIRPFHITDVRTEYTFSVYRKARWSTVFLAVGVALVYLGIMALTGTYTVRKALIIFLLALYKIADGFADVYESECQRSGFLWRGGRELCIRTLLVSGVFLGTLVLTKNLVWAALFADAAQAVVIFIFAKRLRQLTGTFPAGRKQDARAVSEQEDSSSSVLSGKKTGTPKMLLASTALLFLSVFLDFYVFSGAKYAIDLKMGDAASGIFNILFMPTSVIYLVANFIIKPFMTRMAESLSAGDEEEFSKTRRRIAWIITGLTVFVCLCVLLLGRWALGIFEWILGDAYTGQLTGHNGEFFLIILGGGLYALANLYYYILVIRRRQKRIFAVYAAAAVITLVVSNLMVGKMEMTGAAVAYAAMMSLLVFGMKMSDMLP